MAEQKRVYALEVRAFFAAAHHLDNMPEGHPCRQVHGHTWHVIVHVSGANLGAGGLLMDFSLLKTLCKNTADTFDHTDLNTILHPDPPTSEMLAKRILELMRHDLRYVLSRIDLVVDFVAVEEAPGCVAIFYNPEVR